MAGELFKKYYSRLAREGIIKSALVGMIVGFSTLFLTSIVLWLTNEDLFWLAFISGVAVGAVIAPVLYYKKFKPTTKEIARRVDELGLEERVLTMTELENDQSYIALRQREDTVAALQTVNAGLLSIVVSIPLIVATCVTGVFGVGMSVVTALSSAGVIESGREMIEEAMKPLPEYFDIEYEVSGEGGRILNFETEEEIPFQAVEKGKNAIPVIAVPDEGYIFVGWSDQFEDPYREDENVTQHMTLIAEFAELMDGGDMPGGEDGFPGDLPGDLAGDQGNGKPGQGPGAGGEFIPTNQIIDGETFYGHEYEAAFEDVLNVLAQNAEMSDRLKQLISNYFETIKTTTSDDGTSGSNSN